MSFKLKYNDISNFQFQSAVAKIAATPTDGHTAYKIRKITKQIEDQRKLISDEYKKELMETYAKRDEKGEFKPETFEPIEEKRDEFVKAQEDFGNRQFTITRPKLTAHDIRDVKLSAQELDAIDMIVDEESFEKMPRGPVVGRIGAS